ncbi:hypothetical protein CHUAL_003982 [Chamberlinius hualienensis]
MGTIGPSSGPGRASTSQHISVRINNNNNMMGGSSISKMDRLPTASGAPTAGVSSAASASAFSNLQGPATAMATHFHNFSSNFGHINKSPVPSTNSASQTNNHTRPSEQKEPTTPMKIADDGVNGFSNKNNGPMVGIGSPFKRSATPPKPPPKPSFIKKPPFVTLQGSRIGSPLSNHSNTLKIIKKSAKTALTTAKPCRHLPVNVNCPSTVDELWLNNLFLERLFSYFSVCERATLAQVCVKWKTVVYQPCFWRGCVIPVLRCRAIAIGERQQFVESLQQRGFDSIGLLGANDDDIQHLVSNCSSVIKYLRHVILKCSSVTDKGLENLLDGTPAVYRLELSGCNEISEAGLWSALDPRIQSLSISDCINIADESLGAIAQLLPSLCEFNLQAYHVTDVALSYFSQKQSSSLNILRLQSCWEISNQGVSNMVHALPNLTTLSLAGCTKLTDAGVEVIAENLKKLKCLDLSWCSRITDAALEYIACDLTQLEQLTLDRCVHITDIGVGYISTMLSLQILYLRWCSQMGDFGLQHLCSMRNLQTLSVAGCSLLTVGGLSALVQLRNLKELELTNCPGASTELFDYLRQHLPNCLVIE